MHPHLADQKKLHCGDLIKALTECHEGGYMNKMMGTCNGIKQDLNLCLREERLARTAMNKEDSIKRREKKANAWKAIDEDS